MDADRAQRHMHAIGDALEKLNNESLAVAAGAKLDQIAERQLVNTLKEVIIELSSEEREALLQWFNDLPR